MSIELTNAVWKHSRQKSGALLVLLALADYANSKGIAWPAISTLARKVRTSKRNVQRWVRALQQDGELKVLRNEGRRGSNIYKICLPVAEADKGDTRGTNDTGDAKPVTSMSSTNDASVIQSVSESSIQPSPIVPKGDDTDFWIKASFDCFKQPVHPVRPHVLQALSVVVAALNKDQADSLVEFYQTKFLDSKEPPYSSRKHSPERLIVDLPRQLALAVRAFPPARKPDFTIEDVHRYLKETYGDCVLPSSLEELDRPWYEYLRREVYDAMRAQKEKQGDHSSDRSL
jgi:hypothetical protein